MNNTFYWVLIRRLLSSMFFDSALQVLNAQSSYPTLSSQSFFFWRNCLGSLINFWSVSLFPSICSAIILYMTGLGISPSLCLAVVIWTLFILCIHMKIHWHSLQSVLLCSSDPFHICLILNFKWVLDPTAKKAYWITWISLSIKLPAVHQTSWSKCFFAELKGSAGKFLL